MNAAIDTIMLNPPLDGFTLGILVYAMIVFAVCALGCATVYIVDGPNADRRVTVIAGILFTIGAVWALWAIVRG